MADLIIEFLKDYGYWGMGIMAFLAGTVLPITSEVLLLFFLGVGLNAVGLVLAATVGNTIGGITCFMIGYLTTKEKVQKFFKVSDRRMKRADILIQKYGYWTAAWTARTQASGDSHPGYRFRTCRRASLKMASMLGKLGTGMLQILRDSGD